WAARPLVYPRRTWALILLLDRLPWPLGEDLLAASFVARAFVRPRRLRQALSWASAHRVRRLDRWRVALATCANQGRFVARAALTGIRDVATLRRLVCLRGAEHLATPGRGRILLGFHLGPASPHLALRIVGHRVTWIGGFWSAPEAWPEELR